MRKRCRRKVWSTEINPVAHAIVGASITTDDCLQQLKDKEQAAIDAMRSGAATVYTWQELVDMNNICQTMARNGIGVEALPDCMMAEIELKNAAKRFEATGKMLLTGVGLKSIQEVLEWHHLQRTSVSRAKYEQMIEKTRNRIKSRAKDVTVIK